MGPSDQGTRRIHCCNFALHRCHFSKFAHHGFPCVPIAGDAGLSVLKTPKGVSLGDAVASAATMSAELSLAASLPATSGDGYGPAPTDSEGVASTPGTPIAGAASAESQSSAKIEPQAKQTPWESLMAKLSRASLRSPTVRNLPAKRNTPAKLLIPDVLEMMTPEVPQHLAGDAATPLLATPGLSPLPPLTPGAPGSVPLEARVEAVTRLWPILAPFVPCMLREVVLGHNEIRGLVFPQVEKETAAQLQQTPEAASAIEERTTPSARAFNAVIAVADISGFTALTIAMSQEGPPGLELLAKFMNSYFAQIMDLVLAYGGDVSKFAGDALIMVFVPTPREGEASPEDFGLRKTVVRAAACMKEMVERFGGLPWVIEQPRVILTSVGQHWGPFFMY